MHYPHTPFRNANAAATTLRRDLDIDTIDVAVVCGSGLSGLTDAVGTSRQTRMGSRYLFCEPTVAGHAGDIVAGTIGARNVVVFAGRNHLYEGHTVDRVVHNVRVAAALGARAVVLTNAAGAVNPALHVGQLVSISDHLNLTGANPLEGQLDTEKSRFVDMSDAYSPRLRDLATAIDADIDTGVYAAMRGPSYETPAEIAMLTGAGADLVGMSTVCETIAARHCDLEVAAFSLVTNAAAGHGSQLDHSEVTDVGANSAGRVVNFLTRFIAAM